VAAAVLSFFIDLSFLVVRAWAHSEGVSEPAAGDRAGMETLTARPEDAVKTPNPHYPNEVSLLGEDPAE